MSIPPLGKEGVIRCKTCQDFAQAILPEAIDARWRLGRAGGFGPRPEAWRRILERQLLRQWGWPTTRGQGGRRQAIDAELDRDPWARVPIGRRTSIVVTPLDIVLCRFVAGLLDHIREPLDPRFISDPKRHLSDGGIPRWLASAAHAAKVPSLRAVAADRWVKRRDAATCRAVGKLLGVSARTFQDKVRSWRQDVVARFAREAEDAETADQLATIGREMMDELGAERYMRRRQEHPDILSFASYRLLASKN